MNVKPYNDLKELLTSAVNMANEIGVNKQNEVLPIKQRIIMK